MGMMEEKINKYHNKKDKYFETTKNDKDNT